VVRKDVKIDLITVHSKKMALRLEQVAGTTSKYLSDGVELDGGSFWNIWRRPRRGCDSRYSH
jgi:hypothetical protein